MTPAALNPAMPRPKRRECIVAVAKSALAALFEIGGAWLIWQGIREHRGWLWAGLGAIARGAYGFVATLQPDAHFGRILAAYGGVFVAGSLLWGMALDGFPIAGMSSAPRSACSGWRSSCTRR